MASQHDMVQMTNHTDEKKFIIDANLISHITDFGDYRKVALKTPEEGIFEVQETISQLLILLNGLRLQTEEEIERTKVLRSQKSTLLSSDMAKEVQTNEVHEYSGPELFYRFKEMKKGYSLKLGTEPFSPEGLPKINKAELADAAKQIFDVIPGEEVVINAVEENVHYVEDEITKQALQERFKELGWKPCEQTQLV